MATEQKKEGFFKRLISAKGLGKVLMAGLIIGAVGVLASGIGAIGAIKFLIINKSNNIK